MKKRALFWSFNNFSHFEIQEQYAQVQILTVMYNEALSFTVIDADSCGKDLISSDLSHSSSKIKMPVAIKP